ncbi:mechanosensitive ion channel family protein [Cellulomonas massiliensis]|uniref:mechanosensitive ion channel family protein n=1 Tax=Cellulomonas massiliensis TaxID=1465811 RepID=UPI0002E028CC|nr:mechanosensitive ion channel family protein [Cellulomonas massiliensis]
MTAAGPTPEPTSSPAGDYVPQGWGPDDLWDWFLGIPLRVTLIVAISSILLYLLHRLIRTVTNHVAEGSPVFERGRLGESPIGSALRVADPLATARRAQRARTLGSVLRSVASILVWSIAAFLVLDALGVNIAPFIASAGVIGVAVGFGAQSLVKDFLTGLFMLLEDQYGVGDVVDVGPASGTVEAVTMRITKVRDADGVLWYVPNGTMVRVGNKTQGWANAVVDVDVDYFQDVDRVRDLLRQAARRVQDDPVLGTYLQGEPTVTAIEKLSFDAFGLRLKVRTAPAMQWEVARALRVAARDVLQEEGVPLAGQRDLWDRHRAEVPATPDEPGADAEAGAADTPARDPRRTPVEEVVDPAPAEPDPTPAARRRRAPRPKE